MKILSTLSVLLLSQLIHAQSSRHVQFGQPIVEATWTYVKGEKGFSTDRRQIRDILVAEMGGFENPYCLRDTLLNNPHLQANIALGAIIKELHFESVVVGRDRDKGVIFRTRWDNEMSGHLPSTLCKMKKQ